VATQTRNPTSDANATGTWTGSAGSRFGLVDDYPDSGNPIADGLVHGTTAGRITFGFTAFSVPAGSSEISVQVQYYDFKAGSQASAARSLIRCNDTTDRVSATHNPGNGNAAIAARSDNWATNPKTSAAWTVDEVNGIGTNGLTAFGLGASDASPSITFSSVRLQVTYTEPVTGTMAATEAADSTSSSGTVAWVGTAAATEGGVDSASASGAVAGGGGSSPTFVSATPSATWDNLGSSFSVTGVAVQTGDVIVACHLKEYKDGTIQTPTNDGAALVWTQQQNLDHSDENCELAIFTAIADSNRTIQVNFSISLSGNSHGGVVFVFRNASVGNSALTHDLDDVEPMDVSITTSQANSAIVVIAADWQARDGASRAWLTADAGSFTETQYNFSSGNYTVYLGYHPDAGASGAKTVGVDSNAALPPRGSIAAIEIKGTGGGGDIAGDLVATDQVDSVSASGTVAWIATLVATDVNDTASATGSVAWAGTLAATGAIDTGSASGTVQWLATLASTESADTPAISGTIEWAVSLAATDTGDNAESDGAVEWAATLAVTESGDDSVSEGTVEWIATFATTEASDTAEFSGDIAAEAIEGALDATESADSLVSAGIAEWVATLEATEQPDESEAAGSVEWVAALAAVESPDVLASESTVEWLVTLAATEEVDTFFAAGPLDAIEGTIEVTEALDIASVSGSLPIPQSLGGAGVPSRAPRRRRWPEPEPKPLRPLFAAFAVSETNDIAAMSGTVITAGQLAASEVPDSISFGLRVRPNNTSLLLILAEVA
jgi:hypothetical protein